MDYYLPEGYQSRLDPEHVVGVGDDGDVEPDIHAEASALAKGLGARRIVDVDLDRVDDVDLDATGSVLVCANVIERVAAPEKLLALIAGALDDGAAAVILSTQHRELANTSGHLGPPENPANVREWTTDELERFMGSVGLAGHFGLAPSVGLAPTLRTVFVVLPGRAAEYRGAAREWWAERARWQQLLEEQDRTVLRQHAWIGQLRAERDWHAREREAWEARAGQTERALAALAPARWTLPLVRPVARVVRRIVPRRS